MSIGDVQLRKNTVVGAKFEAVEGTDVTPDETDVTFLAQDVTYTPEPTLIERNIMGASFARKKSLATNKLARITFKTDVVGSGTAATPPGWDTLIQACGFSQAINGSVVYSSVTNIAFDAGPSATTGGCSLTLYVWEDGVVKKATGCRGTVRIVGEAGGLAMFEWDFLGKYAAMADAAYLETGAASDFTNLPTETPPLVESATFAVHTDALYIQSFTIDIGNTITPRGDVNSALGIKSIFISDRVVTATINPQQDLKADFDALDALMSDTVGPFTISIGTAAGNDITIASPAEYARVTSISEGERDNILVNDINIEFQQPYDEEAATLTLTHA